MNRIKFFKTGLLAIAAFFLSWRKVKASTVPHIAELERLIAKGPFVPQPEPGEEKFWCAAKDRDGNVVSESEDWEEEGFIVIRMRSIKRKHYQKTSTQIFADEFFHPTDIEAALIALHRTIPHEIRRLTGMETIEFRNRKK